MAPTEIISHGIPISHQLPATPPCSPRPSTPEDSNLSSQAKILCLVQSAQAPTVEGFENISSQLVREHLPVMTGESVASELGDDTPVATLPLFAGDGWEPIFQDSDFDLSHETSSNDGFSDTSSNEASSEASSDDDSSEQDIDLPDSYEFPSPDLADTAIHHTAL